jgi:hypothetical protein
LDEGNGDVKDVVEGEEKADANDPDEEVRERPDGNTILPRNNRCGAGAGVPAPDEEADALP